jgi:tetratricopeptide (TPR) repeat protein
VIDDNPRLIELRRRVQADPASIAFAQLAEEYRRTGENEQAVAVCRAGLAHHPDYLSARVTLGRALLDLGRLDESQGELDVVLATAPDNLAANRALAEVLQKKGQLTEALARYKRALELAKFDPDLEHEVRRITNVVSPPPPPEPKADAPPVSMEDLFDFDTLLAQLGGRTQPKPEFPKPLTPIVPLEKFTDVPLAQLAKPTELPADDRDPFSVLEQQLRESEEARSYQPVPDELGAERHAAASDVAEEPSSELTEEERHDAVVISELEGWLAAIVDARHDRPSA